MTTQGIPLPLPRGGRRVNLVFRPSRTTVSAVAAAIPAAIGTIVLLGWLLGSEPGQAAFIETIPVKPNAGALLLLLGAAQLTALFGRGRRPVGLVSIVLYGLGTLIAGLTVTEYAFGVDLGIDGALFKAGPDVGGSFPDRMSLSAAIGLFLVAVAGAASASGATARLAILFSALAAIVGGLALLGHLYESAEITSGLGAGSEIAIAAAIGITSLALALLAGPGVMGVHDVLSRRTSGGVVARSLLFGSCTVFPALAYVRMIGEQSGAFGFGFGLTVMTAISMAGLSFAGVYLGRRLDAAEAAAEAARRATEDQFLRVIELSDDAICIIGRDGHFKSLNPAWHRLLGYDIDAMTGRRFLDFVHPDDRERTIAEFAVVVADGTPTPGFTNRYQHLDGTYRTIEWSAQVSPETGDSYGIARDITARAAEERDRALLAAVVESTDEALISMDQAGRVLTWNRAATHLFDYSEKEMIGAEYSRIIPTELQDAMAARLAPLLAGASDQDKELETVRVARDGRRIHVSLTLSALRDSKGTLIGATAIERDISVAKATRERLAAASAELAARNAELRDFSSVVSHDLRAPLRRLQMFADMAVAAPGTDPEVSDLLQRIRASADRMEALVIDLLAYARLGASGVTMRPIDLEMVVAEALEELRPTLAEHHVLVDVGHLPTIEGDPLMLRQLFVNLLGNAVKFRAPGVMPTISVQATDPEGPVVEVAVKDNGIGFDAAFADRIFRIFERLATDTPGTGVGLAICRKITDLHQGTIAAASTPGDGATFTIRLPITQPKEQP